MSSRKGSIVGESALRLEIKNGGKEEVNKEVLLGIMLTVLILNMFGVGFGKADEANETIYIRSDGSIDPPTAPIQRVGDVYTFTDDIYNKSIVLEKDNITLDGNGHLLWRLATFPHTGFGIWIRWRRGVTITDIVISNNHAYSLFLDGSSNCRIVNNSILSVDCWWGIRLLYSNYNLLANNTVMNTYMAIELYGSSYNTLSNNEVKDNTHAIWLYTEYSYLCTGNTLRNNLLTSNKYSFLVNDHWTVAGYINDVDTSNTVDGKPIYYWINRCDESVPMDAGCVVIVNSSKISTKNLRLRNTGIGVCLAYTENSIIENVTARGNNFAIWLECSHYNIVAKNNCTDNDGPGIYLEVSSHNTLTDNFVQNTNSSGIWLEDCARALDGGYNKIIGNTVLYSRAAKAQEWDGAGILVDDSSYCQVTENNITSNSFGIVVGAYPARGNQLSGNNIVKNDIGLMLGGCFDNVIYHNNFLDNAVQVEMGKGMWEPGYNAFDGGYPLGGNYWSDYNGTDLFFGPDQNDTGSDGIGDKPYSLPGSGLSFHPFHPSNPTNQDNYPLLHPYVPEMEEIRMAYRSLLLEYTEIHSNVKALNSVLDELLVNITKLQEKYDFLNSAYEDLQGQIKSLNSAFQMSIDDLQEQVGSLNLTLLEQVGSLNSNFQISINILYTQLNSSYNRLHIELNDIRNLMYVVITTTVIFVATTVYLTIKKPKIKP